MTTVASAGRIDVISDAICPWCYIGKRHLERALDSLENSHQLRFSVAGHPFQLNPDMPAEGADRQKYRIAKFGSAPLPTECAATASAAVSSPAAVPRKLRDWRWTRWLDQAQPGHQVGIDAVELFGNRGVRGTAARRRHVLGGRDGG